MFKKILSLPIDWLTLLLPILLTITSIATIYTITFAGHGGSLATSQSVYAIIGLLVMLVFMFTDYRILGSYSGVLLIIGIVLLLPLLPFWARKLPFVYGALGAYRWLNFKIFQLQPAEIFKLIAAIFGAKYMSDKIGNLRWQQALLFIAIMLISFVLIYLEPDLGTAAVVLSMLTAILLATRPPIRNVLWVVAVIIVLLPIAWIRLPSYQKVRVDSFLHPSQNSQGAGENVQQSLIAVGSGGVYGRGFGRGTQTVLNYVPIAYADFIFAGLAEATGFIGSFLLVACYAILIYRAIAIANVSTEPFGALLALAIAVKFAFQAIVHIAVNIGLLPVTGIPLPFMSYGGTALVIDYACIGILESIYIRHKKAFFA